MLPWTATHPLATCPRCSSSLHAAKNLELKDKHMRNFRESGFRMTLPEHSEDQCVWPIYSFPFQLHPLHSLRRPRSMIVKKRPTSSFSWIHALVIYQSYHEVSSLHQLFASHWWLHHPSRHRFQSEDRVCCLIDLDSRIWEPFYLASLRFLSVFISKLPCA